MQELGEATTPATMPSRPAAAAPRPVKGAVPLFAAAILVSSSLLFLVQPMFAKLTLPRLGGSPAVWNTCVLFFQAALLLGYVYAHAATRWLGVRRYAYVHIALLAAPLLVLPLTAGDGVPPRGTDPVWWLLGTMSLTVGPPFFMVSTTAPLLQRWFAALPVASARDPYFLYAASNLGSMVALVGYPMVLEPTIGARTQTQVWTAGYMALVALVSACGLAVRRYAARSDEFHLAADVGSAPSLTRRERIRWLILSFVPSSLMLGVTTHISTDIAAVPLLWVLPLGLYLATFVLAFGRTAVLPYRYLHRLLPILLFASLLTLLLSTLTSWLMLLHLATFFSVAMVCHQELADHRPAVRHLTEFYIWMSLGGVLGGVFNTLLAPHLFSYVFEYPLVLAVAALVRPSPGYRGSKPEPIGLIVLLPALVFLLCVGLWGAGATAPDLQLRSLLLAAAVVLAGLYVFFNRVAAFGVTALAIVAVLVLARSSVNGTLLFAGRSFFGVHRVVDAPDGTYRLLQHGSTTHGRQELPAGRECHPAGYYYPANPIGQVFAAEAGRFSRVAVIGLGGGGLACYADSGDRWTFYEIDPLVERIARDPRYFTFLQNSRGRVDVVLGDGRLTLQDAAPGTFDLIILDAFSSDAIPIHLLTREAVALYLSKLTTAGVIAVHISNRYLMLEPVLGAVAAEVGLTALANEDVEISEGDSRKGRFASHWMVLARTPGPLAPLGRAQGWRAPRLRDSVRPWSDDYSNILQVLKFN